MVYGDNVLENMRAPGLYLTSSDLREKPGNSESIFWHH